MAIIPKKTKYRLSFRNKIQTKKIIKHDYRQLNPLNVACSSKIWQRPPACGPARDLLNLGISVMHHTNAWLPQYPFRLQQPAIQASSNISIFREKLESKELSYDSYRCVFGTHAVAFETHGKLSSKFIETIRLDIAKTLRKKRVWLRLCCDTPVTARPVETRMGKGKGAISHWEAKVRPGQILFEFSGLSKGKANQILQDLRKKSPYALKLISPTD